MMVGLIPMQIMDLHQNMFLLRLVDLIKLDNMNTSPLKAGWKEKM